MNREEQLLHMVRYAYDTVPYYRDKYKALAEHNDISTQIFQSLPIMYKKDMTDTANHISELFVGKYVSGDLIQKNTSGSTGRCLKVFWSLCDDLYANKCAWKLRSNWYGVSLADPYISFHTTLYLGNRLDRQRDIVQRGSNLSINKFDLTQERLKEHVEKIRAHKPVWILAQPSIMNILCSYLAEYESDAFDSVRYIELTGEYLQRPVRSFVKQTFPKAIIANMYSAIEVGVISLECPCGFNHILEENVYLETPDDLQTGVGNVVVTSIRNTAMPFIRYSLGDVVNVLPVETCSCGCSSPRIEILAGRSHENITMPSGEHISPYILLLPIETINNALHNPICQFQIKQMDCNEFEVDLELKPEFASWEKSVREKFLEVMHSTILGHASWDIRFPKHIPLKKNTGKLSFFENLIN